ncbi:MAG: hypothetical protein IPK72_11440 [Candidatus Eisenbacteria bacterium]|nr:hypothetical protein [Candidatus Eisenbacteria bacterium]
MQIRPKSGTPIDIRLGGALVVDAGASINATGFGYAANAGPGAGVGGSGSQRGGGGGHGGKGGNSSTGNAGGVANDVLELPLDYGSGGGAIAGAGGGSGGGIVRIQSASKTTINGTISASGNNASGQGGGGAGGTVMIFAGTLDGTGVINATGGSGSSGGGGGGGGRIAINGDRATNFPSANLRVGGGTATSGGQAGAPGTVYYGSQVPHQEGIVGSDGSVVELSDPPLSVEPDSLEDGLTIRAFGEQTMVTLAADLEVDFAVTGEGPVTIDDPSDLPPIAPTIPAGRKVTSAFLHFDPQLAARRGSAVGHGDLRCGDPGLGAHRTEVGGNGCAARPAVDH